jgi:hypothetical protein
MRDLPAPKLDRLPASGVPRNLVLRPVDGIALPALHWPEGDGQPVLMAHDAGLNAAVAEAEKLQREGRPVLIVDVRDSGETRTRNWRFVGADYYIGYMLGLSWLAMRAEDLLISARWLAERHNVDSVCLVAHGEIGPAALHAAALEPQWIASLQVRDSLPSWRSLIGTAGAYRHLHNAVYGALQYYDLPDLKNLQGESPYGQRL